MGDEWDEDDGFETDEQDENTYPCPYCGTSIYDDAVQCPHCLNYIEQDRTPTSQSRLWMTILKITAVVLLIWILIQIALNLW